MTMLEIAMLMIFGAICLALAIGGGIYLGFSTYSKWCLANLDEMTESIYETSQNLLEKLEEAE